MENLAREFAGGRALPGAATALVGRWVRTGSGPEAGVRGAHRTLSGGRSSGGEGGGRGRGTAPPDERSASPGRAPRRSGRSARPVPRRRPRHGGGAVRPDDGDGTGARSAASRSLPGIPTAIGSVALTSAAGPAGPGHRFREVGPQSGGGSRPVEAASGEPSGERPYSGSDASVGAAASGFESPGRWERRGTPGPGRRTVRWAPPGRAGRRPRRPGNAKDPRGPVEVDRKGPVRRSGGKRRPGGRRSGSFFGVQRKSPGAVGPQGFGSGVGDQAAGASPVRSSSVSSSCR